MKPAPDTLDETLSFDEPNAEIEGIGLCFAKIENIKRQSLSILCANFRILSYRRRIVTLWTSFVKRLR